jgi:hypothetical protein
MNSTLLENATNEQLLNLLAEREATLAVAVRDYDNDVIVFPTLDDAAKFCEEVNSDYTALTTGIWNFAGAKEIFD